MSIKSKITAVILSTCLGSLLVFGLVIMAGISDIRRATIFHSDILGNTAALESQNALESQIWQEMRTLTRSKALLANDKFLMVKNQITRIAATAEHIFTFKERYQSKPINYLQDAEKRTGSPFLLTAPEASLSAIREEVFLAANISDVLWQSVAVDIGLAATYIGGEAGYVIMADRDTSITNATAFDVKSRPWYAGARERDGLFWTDVYEDAFGRGACISCAIPFYDYSGETRVFKGVAGGGILLTDVERSIDLDFNRKENYGSLPNSIEQNGYSFLLDNKGRAIMSSQKEGGGDTNRDYLHDDNPELRELAARMIDKQEGVLRLEMFGEDVFVAFGPLEAADFSIGIVMPVKEIFAPVHSIRQNINELTKKAVEAINGNFVKMLFAFFGMIILTSGIALSLAILLSRNLTAPIVNLCKGAKIIGAGNLNYQLEVSSGDEIGIMSETFNQMIRNIKTINSEKERINGELSAAADIQRSMLPKIFPKFTERSELILYAKMIPAREIGGDFYDFFYQDKEETKIACIIADVSGKGVPAALFMVIAKTLLKIHLLRGINPAETLEAVNKVLCEENLQNMFVTVFLCVLDLETGKMIYANGGHNPPLLSLSGEPYQFMRLKKGVPLGMFEESGYYQEELHLSSGDKLYLYTDGVNETMNGAEEQFGNRRFLEKANACRDLSPEDLDEAVRRELALFAAGAEQFDDITTIAMTYTGGNAGKSPRNSASPESPPVFERETTLPAVLDNLDRLFEWVETFLADYSCPTKVCRQFAMVTEEVFVNIVHCAYPGKTGDVTLRAGRAGEAFVLQYEDEGVPFNPLEWPTPDIKAGLEDRGLGGLGIYLIKKMMDQVVYTRLPDKNQLTVRMTPRESKS
ncbi:MAG: SpoIIE family protein phosphatase [Treponema sp.]|jgi:sigma-B regulation protein RsbU (phosphoserine phosphatase)|nr:SpoIIE family protein phosphatase [Treponema sp.]